MPPIAYNIDAEYVSSIRPQSPRPQERSTNTDSYTADQFEFRSARRKKRSNVSHRRLAEEATVFTTELRRAFVADLEGCTGGIETMVQHQAPR